MQTTNSDFIDIMEKNQIFIVKKDGKVLHKHGKNCVIYFFTKNRTIWYNLPYSIYVLKLIQS